jgi:hypothetical protein
MRYRIVAAVAGMLALAACSVPTAKEYAYPAWGFAVSLRAKPTETASPARVAAGPASGFKVALENAGRAYVVEVADGSASSKTDDQILSEFPQALAQGGTLNKLTYVATGPVMGREFLIDKPGQATERVRIFVSHRRLYEIAAQSPLGPTDPEVDAFLGSFRLLAP